MAGARGGDAGAAGAGGDGGAGDEADAAANVPKYAYMVASGPNSYDLMLWDGAKDKRLVTTAVLGTGVSDAVARLSPDGTRVAYRITGDKNSGSSLRLFTIATRSAP